MRREFDRKLTGLLDHGVATGEFTIDETPLAALAIGGVASWASVWYRPGGRLQAQDIAYHMASFMLAMTQVDKPAGRANRQSAQKETTP